MIGLAVLRMLVHHRSALLSTQALLRSVTSRSVERNCPLNAHTRPVPLTVSLLKFFFGSCPESEQGSRIVGVSILGRPLIKKLPWIPFPIMTSTGRQLIFATCKEEESSVDVYVIDSSLNLHATRESSFSISYLSTEANLQRTSIVSHTAHFQSGSTCISYLND